MRQGFTIVIALAALFAVSQLLAQTSRTAEVQFKAAQHKEQVEGDLKGAIEQYKKLAENKDRAIAAQALIRMAVCYSKLGLADATKAYERVVREFADQTESAALARERLAGSQSLSASHARQAARQIWIANEDASESVPSPDGRYIGFIDWETGDLGVRDLATGMNRHITNSGGWEVSGDYVEGSVISPDGRQIAYNWFMEKELRNELRLLPVNGAERVQPRTLHRSESVSDYMVPHGWTRDGKQLLVVHTLPDRTSQIAMVSVADGSTRVIKSVSWQTPSASLSPDGRYIAYDLPADDKTGARDIFVLAADGSHESVLVQGPANDRAPVWSPDSSRVLFLSNRTGNISLWGASVEDGKPKGPAELMKADLGNIVPLGVTRDGALQYVVLGSNRRNIYIAELDAGMKVSKPPVLATENFLNSNAGPSFSPDGQYLAYFSARGNGALMIRTLKTGEERRVPVDLPSGPFFGAGPMWFPDGRSVLVFARELQRPGFVGLHRVDVTSGNQELLHQTRDVFQGLALSPDGKAVFYSARAPEDNAFFNRLVRFDLDTRQETELKKGEWFIAVAVSPDSKQLAYLVSVRPGAASYVAVMPTAGGESREIFRGSPWMDGSRYGTLTWSPDQRYLLFVRGGVGETSPNVVWRVPVAGGPAEQVGVSMNGKIKVPQIHPDGRRMVFGMADTTPHELWVLENFLPQVAAAK